MRFWIVVNPTAIVALFKFRTILDPHDLDVIYGTTIYQKLNIIHGKCGNLSSLVIMTSKAFVLSINLLCTQYIFCFKDLLSNCKHLRKPSFFTTLPEVCNVQTFVPGVWMLYFNGSHLFLLAYPQAEKRKLAYPLVSCEKAFYDIFMCNFSV